jgi:hypothetical protein
MSFAEKSVIVVGDGYALRSTLSSLVSRLAGSVDVVAGVPDPNKFTPMDGVIAIKADLRDKFSLTATLKERSYARLFLVLPGHADRLESGWNGLEASRDAGILQVVVVSVLTAETDNDLEGHFRPLQDDIERLGRVPVQQDQEDSGSAVSSVRRPLPFMQRGDSGVTTQSSNTAPTTMLSDANDPSKCLRIQRKNGVKGWFPTKVKLVQFSLPNLTRRGGNPVKYQGDNGLAHLERSLCGPYHRESDPMGSKLTLWQHNSLNSLQQFQTSDVPKEIVVPDMFALEPPSLRVEPESQYLPPEQLQPALDPFSVAFLRELQKRKEALTHQQRLGWF